MKTISLLQPWASLVAVGAKRIETRSWATKYRGQLAIHASKGLPYKNHDLRYREPFQAALRQVDTFPLGVIIATCELLGVFKITETGLEGIGIEETFSLPSEPELSFGDYALGRYAWILGNVKMLHEPIPAKGQLGLWEFDMSEHIQCKS